MDELVDMMVLMMKEEKPDFPKGRYKNPFGVVIEITGIRGEQRRCFFIEHHIPSLISFTSWEDVEVLREYGYERIE